MHGIGQVLGVGLGSCGVGQMLGVGLGKCIRGVLYWMHDRSDRLVVCQTIAVELGLVHNVGQTLEVGLVLGL